MGGKKETKAAYFEKLEVLLKEYRSIFIVTVDNVSSQQMHEIRISLRGEGVVLMGKNTMVAVRSRVSSTTPPSTSVSFPTSRVRISLQIAPAHPH